MHTDKEKPTGDGNPTAGNTDAVIVPAPMTSAVTDKEFATLHAQFAMHGHILHRHDENGARGLYAARWGLVRDLPTADDARHFLAQIGGRA